MLGYVRVRVRFLDLRLFVFGVCARNLRWAILFQSDSLMLALRGEFVSPLVALVGVFGTAGPQPVLVK